MNKAIWACLIGLALLTWLRLSAWGDSVALWQDAVKKAPCSDMAHANLAEALDSSGRHEAAADQWQQTFLIVSGYNPDCPR